MAQSVVPVPPTERTRLIQRLHPTSRANAHLKSRKWSMRFRSSILSPHRVCLSSRAVALIFGWTFVVGALYEGMTFVTDLSIQKLEHAHTIGSSPVNIIIGVYITLAIATMFYPLAGYIADVWYGQYRVVIASLLIMWMCFLSILVMDISDLLIPPHTSVKQISMWIILVLSFVLCIVALAGFTSNIVQLGFDQLLDEPSHSLGMFVHWFFWFEMLGAIIIHTIHIVVECSKGNKVTGNTLIEVRSSYTPLVFLLILSALLMISFFNRKYFYTERVQKNPYKLILTILNFARKNKCPVSPPSAFVYTYHRKPSRLDFAKEVYGGPFNNSDVDDVRTFLRVLFILLALGPIFILQVPGSYTVFTLFGRHTGKELTFDNSTCSMEWILFQSNTFSFMLFILFFVGYIWFVYSVLRNRIPKILTRLGFASILFISAVVSMLAIDLSGHLALHSEGDQNMTCMFLQPYRGPYEPLHLSWWVLTLPNILTSCAPHILLATALEFISAQGPHLMKGVLVGILFAIKGFYQLIGASLVYLFAFNAWNQGILKQISSMISCEFGYFLVTVLIASIGFICFVVCARKYKYRVRGEEGFSQSDVEEVFERRLIMRQEQNILYARRCEQEMSACQDDGIIP